jgi:hypothetical protein
VLVQFNPLRNSQPTDAESKKSRLGIDLTYCEEVELKLEARLEFESNCNNNARPSPTLVIEW